MMPAARDAAAAHQRGPGPDVGRVRRALPARGADVRVLAVQGHPLGGEVRRPRRWTELRAEGVYRVVTPQECAALGADSLVLHPLCGGMPVDEGWRSLHLFCETACCPRTAPRS